jgi:hypothetical protein
MASVDAEELELLQRKAAAFDLYLNEHRNYDPCRGTGSLFIIEKRKFRDQECRTYLKYATPEQCWEFLNRL